MHVTLDTMRTHASRMGKMLDRDTTRQLYFLCTQGSQSLLLSCNKTNYQGNVNLSVAVYGLVGETAL
jgi:hypothetical protein